MPKAKRPRRQRLDALLAARGLCETVEAAKRTIWAGEVIVDGDLVDQPAALIPVTAEIRLRGRRYATRGGDKLEGALAALKVEVRGRCVVDVGTAAGGFTDCLLSHGAGRVYAIDVGRGQLIERLRLDPRVVDMGGRDVMELRAEELDPAPSLAVVDVTFRSLSDVLPKVWGLLAEEREVVALVKSLHEAKLAGIEMAEEVQQSVFAWLLPRLREAGIPVSDIVPCTEPGTSGAMEFFLHAKSPGASDADLQEKAERAAVERPTLLARRAKRRRSGQKRRRTWRRFGARGS
jgi:23S rRNA (cytidine1920-2'-O)/16S rRNA (cytidine1409-2'-O)-methyltransferase